MTTRREKLLQKLNPKFLKMTPKLSGDTGSFIDLNSNDSSLEDGARKLMMRFLKNQDLCDKYKRNSGQNDVELTISSAKYNENEEICEIISERLTVPLVIDGNDDFESDKPGKKLQKLKMELQDKMSAKWEEEYKKRVGEKKLSRGYKESKNKGKEKTVTKDRDSDGASDDEKSHSAADSEEEVTQVFEENQNNDFDADIEDEESDDSDAVSDVEENHESFISNDVAQIICNKDDEFYESESCSLVPAYQPGGGLLYGGSELTQCDEELPQNLLSPSLKLSVTESPGPKSFTDTTTKNKEDIDIEETDNSFLNKNKLFSNSQNVNDSFDLNDAFELCSGKFPDAESSKAESETQTSAKENSAAFDESDFSDKNMEAVEEKSDSNSEENKILDSEKDLPKSRKNIMIFEESESEDHCEVEGVDEPLVPGSELLSEDEDEDGVLIANMKKKTMKMLQFSDEEDETSDCKKPEETTNSDHAEQVADSDEEDFDKKSVYYDSEENEILNPREFFEREAELSGSEWSGDEDERGLDEFDKEDGDADNIDDDQVRSQLEKIHIRRVLDDDAREVRLIQEILFEDGDLHGDGKKRDRKFKWKNLGTFEEGGNEGEAKEEGGNSSEEDCAEEEELRKIRHEKELFLMEKKNNGDLSSDEEIFEENFQAVKVATLKNSFKLFATSENKVESAQTILKYSEGKKTLVLSNTRGSFLTRNEEFLSRLAKATSGISDNVLGPKNSKNFVFATKSPEKTKPDGNAACKRQVEESESYSRREKRMKSVPPDITTGPSILDLLV